LRPFARWSRRITLVSVSLFMVNASSAQTSAATGTIEGRVQNATNGLYLRSAEVSIAGTQLVTLTNQAGEYRLVGVPAGSATLKVNYGGLNPKTATVSIAGGQTLNQDFSLSRGTTTDVENGVVKLDPFTVNAARDFNA